MRPRPDRRLHTHLFHDDWLASIHSTSPFPSAPSTGAPPPRARRHRTARQTRGDLDGAARTFRTMVRDLPEAIAAYDGYS